MIKVLIADEIDLAGIKKLSRDKYTIKTEFGISNDDIEKFYANYDVLVIRSIRKITKGFLDNTSFKVIATCSKGTDHIDTDYAGRLGVSIINAEDSNHISAAEHTIGLILAIFKKILLSDKLIREGNFSDYDFERNELFGKSIGIVGFGKVGSYVGNLCKAFGMKVYANDIEKSVKLNNKNFEFKSLNFILKNCDVITIHIPLNKKNYYFFSKEKLMKINKKSILINTSRGDVIDEKILLRMLKEGKIKYSGLDVFSNEPSIDKGFRHLSNVVLTNHTAGKTQESRRRISENIFLSINNYF